MALLAKNAIMRCVFERVFNSHLNSPMLKMLVDGSDACSMSEAKYP